MIWPHKKKNHNDTLSQYIGCPIDPMISQNVSSFSLFSSLGPASTRCSYTIDGNSTKATKMMRCRGWVDLFPQKSKEKDNFAEPRN